MSFKNCSLTSCLALGLLSSAGPVMAGDYDDLFQQRYDSPEDIGVLGSFVSKAVEVGQYDQAISTLEQHLVKYPRDARAKFNLAKAYANTGSWELAKRNLEDALEIGDLTPQEADIAQKLLARTNGALAGFEWALDASVGIRSTWLETDQMNVFPADADGWRDRQDFNPYFGASGSLRMDLDTPLNDALIWSGGFLAERRYEDIKQGFFNPFGLNRGGVYLHNRGHMALTLDKGIETTDIDALRVQFGVFASWRTYNPSVTDVSLGTSLRMIVQPSVDTAFYLEGKYSNLEQSSNLPAEHRIEVEAGASWRLSHEHSVGVAVKWLNELNEDPWIKVSESRELEVSYSGLLPYRPFVSIWTHQIVAGYGDFATRQNAAFEFFVPAAQEGEYWKASWRHTFQIDGQNSISLDYTFRRVDFDTPPFSFDRDHTIHSTGVSYTKSF